jgi:TATA-binding protein-associated factor Taf7
MHPNPVPPVACSLARQPELLADRIDEFHRRLPLRQAAFVTATHPLLQKRISEVVAKLAVRIQVSP